MFPAMYPREYKTNKMMKSVLKQMKAERKASRESTAEILHGLDTKVKCAPVALKKPERLSSILEEVERDANWQRVYDAAVQGNHPDPVKMADSAMRSRNKAKQVVNERRKLEVVQEVPKQDFPVPEKVQKKKCQATKLDGYKCEFGAVFGNFCKRHAPK
jgi:hypothetical protein